MKTVLVWTALLIASAGAFPANASPQTGLASWYGESHRGRLMANHKRFDPNKLTAASWFYPLGTRLRVSLKDEPSRSVLVTVTDRGPAKDLVHNGRIIDLTHAAFKTLAPTDLGLVGVIVQPAR